MLLLKELAQALDESCIIVGRCRSFVVVADLGQQLLPGTQVKVLVGYQAEQQEEALTQQL